MLYAHAGDNRGLGEAQHDLARGNIYSEFSSFGLAASYHPFTYLGQTYYNVVGTHYGTTRPDDIYIVGAHYDSASTPGADDNASGTAGVLEAARVLSQYDFEATLIFIGFDREEQGLIGSTAYAGEHIGDDILGMISLDMIAYNHIGSNRAQIRGSDSSAALKQSLADSISLYGNGLTGVVGDALNRSDHYPFETRGFQACLLIEDGYLSNPNYHRTTDSVDTLNYIDYSFATNMVSSTVGFLATAAVPVPEPATVLLLAFGAVVLRTRLR
jgi:Zn-dependent M28 family amino/carboxypeptidase